MRYALASIDLNILPEAEADSTRRTRMKRTTSVRSSFLALLAVALLATAAGPAWAKEKREPIEKFKARAFSLDRGRATHLDIVIYEWTTPEERQALFQTFVEQGSRALYNALDDQSDKGYLKLPQTLAYDMQYAWQFEVEGKRRIVLATDRPMGFLELSRGARTIEHNVSLVVLDIDPETGEGEGLATGGAELSIDKKTGRLVIEFVGTQPTQLKQVKTVAPKKKKKKKGE
jgi:hypothetical protein